MLRSAVQRWWDTHKIYHTQVFQELWVGIILTGYVYYKISYGGKIYVLSCNTYELKMILNICQTELQSQ
uniref:Uncharacterized protein n=1 Tax=Anolis carolinensis TaxID=28377 RepID=A0A803TVD4_ANOCA